MGIYIKGMEMPKNCGDCPFGRDEDAQYYACDLSEWSCVNPDGRELMDDCPLIELPPHGRLIDADAVTAKVAEKGRCADPASDEYPLYIGICEVIDDASTIIEAEGVKLS